jgi:hypothetical protein
MFDHKTPIQAVERKSLLAGFIFARVVKKQKTRPYHHI